jgi:hypothetical protein
MLKRHSYLYLTLSLCTYVMADEGPTAEVAETSPAVEAIEAPALAPAIVSEPVVIHTPEAAPEPSIDLPFHTFTGKIKGKKVRMRAQADLESKIVKELNRNDLLLVVGEKGDFYAVQPPTSTKAYVFRSFILDGIVEGNRVNVRLEPSLDSPVIAHLNAGDHIKGAISSLNNKWYEIDPPSNARFYVAKEYVESIGGPEVKIQLDRRKMAAEQILDAAALLTKSEMQKPFSEISLDRIKHNYDVVMSDYADLPELAEKAKEALTSVQEAYLQKKLSFLEKKTEYPVNEETPRLEMALNPTDRMKLWEPVEESLYLGWSSSHDDRSIAEFYEEQKQNATVVTGILESYTAPVKRKPGDFMLRDKELPVAYLYSTHINLQDFIGKKVTIVAAPRSNNNFAFPAYYVLSVE